MNGHLPTCRVVVQLSIEWRFHAKIRGTGPQAGQFIEAARYAIGLWAGMGVHKDITASSCSSDLNPPRCQQVTLRQALHNTAKAQATHPAQLQGLFGSQPGLKCVSLGPHRPNKTWAAGMAPYRESRTIYIELIQLLCSRTTPRHKAGKLRLPD